MEASRKTVDDGRAANDPENLGGGKNKSPAITRDLIAMHSSWKHSGFHVFCGNRISPNDDTAMENLARYIIRASFSQERMQYLDQEGTVVYTGKDRKTNKVSKSNHSMILSTATRNTPGMNTSSHNAFLKNKIRRAGEVCLNSVQNTFLACGQAKR